jgi:sporulation protein YlmC with PRC-barrel domain
MPEIGSNETHVDAMLLLLDRQITDVEGRMVAKVDDVEITEAPDGTVAATGLLCGPAALLPRLGGRFGGALHRFWLALGRQQADRGRPYWIDLADVRELGSEVRLGVARDGLLVTQPGDGPDGRRRRLNDLLGMRVYDAAGTRLGRVLDVQLDRAGLEQGSRSALVSLVVGRGRPGSRFGYDRRPEMGPALLSQALHRLQGKRGSVKASDIRSIDWELGQLEVRAAPTALLEARRRR